MTVSVQMVDGNMTVLVAACCAQLSPLWPQMRGQFLVTMLLSPLFERQAAAATIQHHLARYI